ncbi:Ferric reductase B [Hyphodiscus hymeniophilus]|uniref:Ferric reductase B n=1 Tax=Hyphodiscus hymeniophilus TaxID=353542 RepID=A0A9P6VFN1_9HELO|nr:Ferric reductase B [Hyphodiscus hymeniophilus]
MAFIPTNAGCLTYYSLYTSCAATLQDSIYTTSAVWSCICFDSFGNYAPAVYDNAAASCWDYLQSIDSETSQAYVQYWTDFCTNPPFATTGTAPIISTSSAVSVTTTSSVSVETGSTMTPVTVSPGGIISSSAFLPTARSSASVPSIASPTPTLSNLSRSSSGRETSNGDSLTDSSSLSASNTDGGSGNSVASTSSTADGVKAGIAPDISRWPIGFWLANPKGFGHEIARFMFKIIHPGFQLSSRLSGTTLCNDIQFQVVLCDMESVWLREALRFSLKATAYTSSTDGDRGPPEQRDPKLRKLVEGIIYSRKYVPTYNLVILGFFVTLSVVHWSREAVRWSHRRSLRFRTLSATGAYDGETESIHPVVGKGTLDGDSDGPSSSGSSTLDGVSLSRKDIDEDEETPLLDRPHSHEAQTRRSIVSCFKSFLMYQPRPIPFFNKALPSNGMSLVILALFGLNIFYSFFHIKFTIFELFVLADRFGLLFVVNLPLLYLLAAKNQPLRVLTGCSYEFLNIFHRRLGEILCLQAFLHFAGMIMVWYTLFRPNKFGFIHFLFLPVILLGLGAFFSYEVLYFTSLASFRQRWYEIFLAMHIFLQIAGLILVFFHHSGGRPYVGAALGIFLVDRLGYRVGLKSTTVRADMKVMEDGETVKLSTHIIKKPLSSSFRMAGPAGRCIKDGWLATDHIFITVPSLGRSHLFQAHPFTIASAAPREEDDEHRLELLIRAQKGFSHDLLKRARHHNHLTIRIDGPYGSSHARTMLEDSELAIIIAGGSGIAVAWPLVHHLLGVARSTDTEIAPTSSLRRQKIVLVWVVHKKSHMSWIDSHKLVKAANNGVDIIVPPATEESGRPDLELMIDGLVDRYEVGQGKKVGVVASGPDSMGRLVRNTCAKLVKDGLDVDVTIEKFGW